MSEDLDLINLIMDTLKGKSNEFKKEVLALIQNMSEDSTFNKEVSKDERL